MVEGGPQLLTQLLREQLLDALHVFVRAGILGGTRNRIGRLDVRPGEDPLAVNPSRSLMDRDDYQLLATYQIEDDVVLECLHRRHAIGFVS
jgi:riboflavin biosynthesis pyrimidine reductase